MAPKNKKKNSFYFFMKEMQEKEARKGHNISMVKLPDYAHPIWKQMSLAEREPYEEMARRHKNDPNLRGGKLASDGTSIEENLRKEEEKQRLENKMKQDVKRYCNSDCPSTALFHDIAPKKIFYFMTFNILCCTDDEEYVPIEVAIVEYSIHYGVHRDYVKIMYPGHPPPGCASTAVTYGRTHEISPYGEHCQEKDIRRVYNEMKTFTNPLTNDEYPPVFCTREDIPITRGCLEWLSKVTGKENVFEVWDATYLLLELRAGIDHPLPSYAVASDLLHKFSFNYHPSTRCDFHEELDSHCCALSYSKGLCYLLSDAVCALFDITLTEKHIPAMAIEEKAYTVTVVKEATKTNSKDVRLDKTKNYYKNEDIAEEETSSAKGNVPRQPASTCIAAQMNQLQLDITAATLPGHGIGRGTRRKF